MSDMGDAIPPALTPEEWAHVATHGGGRPETAAWVERHVGDLSVIQFRDGSLRVHQQADQYGTDVTTPQRHALAALALVDQPSGFTQEMLRALEVIVGHWDGYVPPEMEDAGLTSDDVKRAAVAAIARIAALLPAVPPTGHPDLPHA